MGVRKALKIFGTFVGVAINIAEILADREWKSPWFVIIYKKHSYYAVKRYYWKPFADAIAVEG